MTAKERTRPNMKIGTGKIFSTLLLVLAGFALYSNRGAYGGVEDRGTVLIAPSQAIAGSWVRWSVTYQAGRHGIREGGGIQVQLPANLFAWPHPPHYKKPQAVRPDALDYVTVAGSNSEVDLSLNITNNTYDGQMHRIGRMFVVTTKGGALAPGDTITVTFGDTAGGKNLGTRAGVVSQTAPVIVTSDDDGDGYFQSVTSTATVTILPAKPKELVVVAPSSAVVGVPFKLRIRAFDKYSNLASGYRGEVELTSTDPRATFPKRVLLSAADGGKKDVSVTLHSPGFHRFTLTETKGLPTAAGNPIQCSAKETDLKIYWGDLHSHSVISKDGAGVDPYGYARDIASLDFYASTEHTTDDRGRDGVTDADWERIKKLNRRFYQPGNFVTLLGYEASLPRPYGHHNVFYRSTDEPIFRANKYGTLGALWRALENRQAFTVPHHTGIGWGTSSGGPTVDWSHRNDRLRRAVEIYSLHGFSELYDPRHPLAYDSMDFTSGRSNPGPHYARDAWASGQLLAALAASDDHESHPGKRFGGLAGVFAPELTREAVFDGLYAKRCYATTGERILLYFEINGTRWAERVTSEGAPRIQATVVGTDDLDFVEVAKYDYHTKEWSTNLLVRPDSSTATIDYRDHDFSHPSAYYLRVKQKRKVGGREVWAWSTPVWVDPK